MPAIGKLVGGSVSREACTCVLARRSIASGWLSAVSVEAPGLIKHEKLRTAHGCADQRQSLQMRNPCGRPGRAASSVLKGQRTCKWSRLDDLSQKL